MKHGLYNDVHNVVSHIGEVANDQNYQEVLQSEVIKVLVNDSLKRLEIKTKQINEVRNILPDLKVAAQEGRNESVLKMIEMIAEATKFY